MKKEGRDTRHRRSVLDSTRNVWRCPCGTSHWQGSSTACPPATRWATSYVHRHKRAGHRSEEGSTRGGLLIVYQGDTPQRFPHAQRHLTVDSPARVASGPRGPFSSRATLSMNIIVIFGQSGTYLPSPPPTATCFSLARRSGVETCCIGMAQHTNNR